MLSWKWSTCYAPEIKWWIKWPKVEFFSFTFLPLYSHSLIKLNLYFYHLENIIYILLTHHFQYEIEWVSNEREKNRYKWERKAIFGNNFPLLNNNVKCVLTAERSSLDTSFYGGHEWTREMREKGKKCCVSFCCGQTKNYSYRR